MRHNGSALSVLFTILLGTNLLGQEHPRSGNWQGRTPPKTIIKGEVAEAESHQSLEYATIAVISKRDSSVVSGGVTGPDGAFEIETRPGQFFIRIEFVSFQEKIIDDIVLNRENLLLDLGTIYLKSNIEVLNEVVVEGERSQIEFALDKKIFTIGKDMVKTGGSAADILDNIPSIVVDVEGNVSLRGSQDVRILIDGKPSGLIGLGSTDALRQLQANLVEKVEVITNPSAKYDAEGNAGIINIILKKDTKNGFNGSFDFNTGYPHNHGGAFNINRRQKSFNLFASYGIMYRKRPGGGSTQTNYFLEDSTFFTDRQRKHERGGLSHNFRGGADFYLNKFNTITGALIFRKSIEDNVYDITYRDYDSSEDLIQTVLRKDNEEEIENNLEYSVNYTKTFEQKGRKFEASVQFWEEIETETSNIVQREFDEQDVEQEGLLQRSLNHEGEQNLLMQFDYLHPLGEQGKFEGGYRSTLRDIGNDFKVEEYVDGVWEIIPEFTNNFLYNENIFALYAIAGNKTGSFSYQLGLRSELTNIRTELEETSEVTHKDYLDLFPSGHLTYEFNENRSTQLSYSRRIRRPHFRHLNPFSSFSDPRFIRTGNPDLNPEYTNSTEISFLNNWAKGTFNSSVYHRYTTGVIRRITRVEEDGVSYSRPENLDKRHSFGLEFIFSWDALKWWRLNSSLNFFRSITDGGNIGEEFQADTYSWMGRINSLMTIAKKTDFQMRFNYRAPQETTQGKRYAYYFLDVGFSRDVLKKNGTLSLNLRDVFNSRKWSGESSAYNFFSTYDFQWRSRQILVGFTYRLNQKKKRGRRNGGAGGRDFGGDDAAF